MVSFQKYAYMFGRLNMYLNTRQKSIHLNATFTLILTYY